MDWDINDQRMIDYFNMVEKEHYKSLKEEYSDLKKEYEKLKEENERLKKENEIIPEDLELVSKNMDCTVIVEYDLGFPEEQVEKIVKEKYCKTLFKNLEVYKLETLEPVLSENNICERYYVRIPERQIDFKDDNFGLDLRFKYDK